jgi:general secretion pathway protein M
MNSIKTWFSSLDEQDQKITLYGAVIFSVLMFYLLVLSPINESVNSLNEDVVAKQNTVNWMKEKVSIIRSNKGITNNSSSSLPLTSIVNSTTKKYNLSVSRRDSKSPNEMQVWFDNVSFDSFLSWVSEIEKRHGVIIASVNVRSRDQDGITSINVKLLK